MAENKAKAAWIAAISSVVVALVAASVTIFTTVYNKPNSNPDPLPTEVAGNKKPNRDDPLEKLKRMNVPLKPLSGPAADLSITARLSVQAPSGTLLDLDLYRGETRVGQIVGKVTDTNEESWTEGLRLVRTVAILPRIPGATRVRGEIITSFGRTLTVDVTEPAGADLADVYDMDLEIDAEGGVQIVHAVVCPWVYVFNGEKWNPRVEIIRNLLGKLNEKTQGVRLGTVVPAIDGEISLQVREELDEVSFIDQLGLELEGYAGLLRPVYASQELESLLEIDGDYLVLRKGDIVELRFHNPRFKAGISEYIVMRATGYYEFTDAGNE